MFEDILDVLNIQPSSAIRTDYDNFSKLCHSTMDPVLVTHNGVNDIVAMSYEAFFRREAGFRLQAKLAIAEKQVCEGKPTSHKDVFSRLRIRFNLNNKCE